MAQVGLKAFLWALLCIVLMLMLTGIIQLKPDGYACAGGWESGFQERVEIFRVGPVRIGTYPYTRTCPEERRYDPSDVEACKDTGFCTLPKSTFRYAQ